MAQRYIDKVYQPATAQERQQLYDEWATQYDAELAEQGYATPQRVAEALWSLMPRADARILDFACGTGLSGQALTAAGFGAIDGVDISEGMIAVAHGKAVYRDLRRIEPGGDMGIAQGQYDAICAVGAISPGAAPLVVFDALMETLTPGGLFVFSFNDHALDDPAFPAKVAEWVDSGGAVQRLAEHGPHLPKLDLGATVYVLERV